MKHRTDHLDKLASHLLEKEVIFKEDLELIFGKRPFEDRNSDCFYQNYVPPVIALMEMVIIRNKCRPNAGK